MIIEFITTLDDYKFAGIKNNTVNAVKETLITTLCAEKVAVRNFRAKRNELFENQTCWIIK